MALLGTIVNGVAIIIGGLLGLVFRNISEKMRATVMQGIGLAIIILGIGMGLKSKQYLIVISSIAIGSVFGEMWDLEGKMNALGDWLEKKVGNKNRGSISKGFVTATLVYVVGAMAIVGALDSGLRLDHTVLFTKSMLDGISSIIFTSALGLGVLFSAVPVIIYEGILTLLATQIHALVPEVLMNQMILEVTAVGGILIVAIGLNMLKITTIRIANMLPSLVVTILLILLVNRFPILNM
ncbi:DUF554 domain-containing protein [Ectobacillus sp. sgz5001026]|uniref:DUF554 domain-containing protein n=1 Tax=Ectobacillus sp. sgz5001026 TaxID=3242473 RepID=UPI0036D3FC7D